MTEKSTIEFKIAKSGHLVPVVDQIFLHSIYDPIKEAEVFVESHVTEIENNPCVLILGLGFAYHALQTMEKLKEIHGVKAQLMVIEANQHLVERFISYAQDKNVKIGFHIFTGEAETIYSSDRFLDFLLKRPQVLVHRTSFQKDKAYYEKILKYSAAQNMDSYWSTLRPGLKDFLNEISHLPNTFEDAGKLSSNKEILSREDYFILFANALRLARVEKF